MNDETLEYLSGTEIVQAIHKGEVLAERVTSFFVDRIQTMNPSIGSVRDLLQNEAMEQATQVDIRRSKGDQLGPLAGMPVIVKENCDVKGVVCSAGLSCRRQNFATTDSEIVRELKAADAIILGTSVSDPGTFGTRTLEVTHPWDSALSVGGSSGGSAAALAARMCLGAIGTDSGGSIRIPAAFCGVTGLKPTFNALPINGVSPLAPSLDHVGPMARDVCDLELMWCALSEQRSVKLHAPTRVGYDPALLEESDPRIRYALKGAIDKLLDVGIECVEVPLPDPDTVLRMHGTIIVHEAWRAHCQSGTDVLENLPEVAQRWFEVAKRMPDRDFCQASALRSNFTLWIDRLFEQVGAILTPTVAFDVPDRLAETVKIAGKPREFVRATIRNTCLFNHTGHPALVLPLDNDNNTTVPVSAQLISAKSQDQALFSLAKQLIQA